MAFLTMLAAATLAGKVANGLYVALGLGLVIFFHELGHFAVAKWCNVFVERFSIGFGPILFSRKYGETEYALSWIPFGGYVKMLGQDDMDPSQLSSEDIAKNPRSYSAKSVPQRMAIISAGVIMNILTAVIFFGVAFGLGIKQPPATVGNLQAGMPAWNAGMRIGDRVTAINGREVDSFGDVLRGVALSTGQIRLDGVRTDGEPFHLEFTPDKKGTRRRIGMAPSDSLTLVERRDEGETVIAPFAHRSAAALAKPALKPHDTIRKVDGTPVKSLYEFQQIVSRRRDEPIRLEIERRDPKAGPETKAETFESVVEPNPFRTLGLWLDIGKIVAVQAGSPAEGKIKVDDKILKINDQVLGEDINPLRLPDVLAGLHGQEVKITLRRQEKGGDAQETVVTLEPRDAPGWLEVPMTQDNPLSVPAIGVAFHILPVVLKVESNSLSDGKVQAGERIRAVELIRKEGAEPDHYGTKDIKIPKTDDKTQPPEGFYSFAFALLQELPGRTVKLTVSRDGEKTREVALDPAAAPAGDWHSPDRGFFFDEDSITLKAAGPADAVSLGMSHTRNTIVDIYLTLRNVLTGDVSFKELHGPVMIARVAYGAASQGIADLSLFLGLLSVNLAVINFLPIPVLDGGHMVFLIWEAVTRRKPSERVLVTAQYFGLAFVLGLMCLVLFLDLFVHSVKPG